MAALVPTSSPLSSAQSSEATFRTASPEVSPRYQQVQTLPFELLSQVKIYLEENYFAQAFRFLLSIITTSTSNQKNKVYIPPPQYLSLAASIAVHPTFSTRALTQDKWAHSNSAIQLLRTINKVVGPVNARLTEAYRFRKFDNIRVDIDDSDEEPTNQKLEIRYAEVDSLFNTKDDFWAVVGWALNCSCLNGMYAARWKLWKPWLEHMLEVLEADWSVREEVNTCHESLLWQYILTATGGNARARRILRAVFADGSDARLVEFSEVFRKELKEPKSQNDDAKKQEVAVDIENEIYGDWLRKSESSADDENGVQVDDTIDRPSKRLRTRTPSARRRQTPRTSKTLNLTDTEDSDASALDDSIGNPSLGPPESIHIRLRLMQLLSVVSANPILSDSEEDSIFPDLHELYTLFTEFIKPLDLLVFQQLILPSASTYELSPDVHMNLCDFVLHRVAENQSARRYAVLDSMTQQRFTEEYLQHAASSNSIEMQAKMSLLLESVLRQSCRDQKGWLTAKPELLEALKQGIERRTSRAKDLRNSGRYKKANKDDENLARQILDESATRMRFAVKYLSG